MLLNAYFVSFLAFNVLLCSFILFVVVLVTIAEYVQVYPEESTSTGVEAAVVVESRKEVVVEEIVVQKTDKKLPKQIIPEQKISQPVRERDDDWFLLLDVVPRETSFVPPGTHITFPYFLFTHIIIPKEIHLTNELCVSSKLFKDNFRCYPVKNILIPFFPLRFKVEHLQDEKASVTQLL